jgi:LacI family transcriptional regulator
MASTQKPAHTPPKAVGIKDIARALGVSIATVDRALHDKPGINPLTRARVLGTAESLGYRPNLAARHLKSPRAFRIAVHLPRELALFWDRLRDGILEAAAGFQPLIEVEFGAYPRLGEGDVPLFRAALAREVNGLIIAPGDPDALRPWIRRAAKQNVPVVCVVTDAPDTERLTSVSADPFTVGAVAGEMLSRFLPAGGEVAFFTGWLGTQDHADKLRGFKASLKAAASGPSLAAVVEAHDEERAGHRRALDVLKTHPQLKGIYVSTVNSLPVLDAVRQMGRQHDLVIVTTDLFPALVPWIRDGSVAATVYQRPLSQGRLALTALRDFLVNGTYPPPTIKLLPHLVMRSNVDLMLTRLRLDAEASEASPPRALSEV